MHAETVRKLEKVRHVRGSLDALARIASDERLEMLQYLLDMAYYEALKVEGELEKKEN